MLNATNYHIEDPSFEFWSAAFNALFISPLASSAAQNLGLGNYLPRVAVPLDLVGTQSARRQTPAASSPRALNAPARPAAARPPGRGPRRPRRWSGFRASCRRARGGGGRAVLGRGGGGTCCARGCAVRLPPLQFAREGAAAAATATGAGAMRRYLRIVVLCLACGFCSLLYAFSQLAVSLEEGAGGGGGKPQAEAVSWLADGGRGAARGAGIADLAAHPGGSHRYGRLPVWPGRGEGREGAGMGGRGAQLGPGCLPACPAPPAAGTAPPASLPLFLTPFIPFPPSPPLQG